MKKRTQLQKISRMMSLILVMAALPFALQMLENKLKPQRQLASDEGSSSGGANFVDKDLTQATPEEFSKAFKYQVLKDVSVLDSDTGPRLRLGLFLMKNSSGGAVFVCDEYPTVDLVFAAEGVAFSGEIPRMVVRGPCVVSADQQHIETATIPFFTIFRSPTNQYEFATSIENSRESARIYFRNVVEFWPREWNLVGIKFYGKNPQDTLDINGYEVISVLGKPLILKTTE